MITNEDNKIKILSDKNYIFLEENEHKDMTEDECLVELILKEKEAENV